ncbi:MAG: hypothetical protein WCQ57_02960 [Verrucomicrobiota bacterium]
MPQPVNIRNITIARNGAILGAYGRAQATDMLDTGQLLASDHYYDEIRAEWVLLSDLSGPALQPPSRVSSPLELRPASEIKPSDSLRKKSSKRGTDRGKSRGKKQLESVLIGWIACLFALVAAAGIWAWAEYLHTQLKISDEKIKDMGQKIEVLNREKELLTEITPRGRVRGIITYENAPNQVAIMTGATVALYHRTDVENALATALQSGGITSTADFDRTVERFKSAVGPPLEISLTDSNGRIDMPVSKPGSYVLVASAARSNNEGRDRYLWLVGFSDTEQPSGLIFLNESTATSNRKPRFDITDVHTVTTGVERPESLP